MKQESVLKLKKELIDKNEFGIALDIDETICSTCEFWADEALRKIGNPENISGYEFFKKYKFLQNAPYWTDLELNEFCEYARNSEHMHFNANPFEKVYLEINELDKNIKVVAYITARTELLSKITKEWLSKHNFPIAPVILKPHEIKYRESNKWKARVLEYLYPQITGIVDDNPKLAEEISDDYKGKNYLLSYENHKNEKHNVVACYDWNKVHLEILK